MRNNEYAVYFRLGKVKAIHKFAFSPKDAIILAMADKINDGLDSEVYMVIELKRDGASVHKIWDVEGFELNLSPRNLNT